MDNMRVYSDTFGVDTMVEDIVTVECLHCSEEIEESEAIYDEQGNPYCDYDCLKYAYGIQEARVQIGTCLKCKEIIYSDDDITTDEEGDLFCCQDCAIDYWMGV
jgi:hypothetical protein